MGGACTDKWTSKPLTCHGLTSQVGIMTGALFLLDQATHALAAAESLPGRSQQDVRAFGCSSSLRNLS